MPLPRPTTKSQADLAVSLPELNAVTHALVSYWMYHTSAMKGSRVQGGDGRESWDDREEILGTAGYLENALGRMGSLE